MITKKFHVYKLKFTSPLHISRGYYDDYSKSDLVIHSDTLKSAIFSTAILLNPDLTKPNVGELFFNSFLLSSTFPFYKDALFLPKPKSKIPIPDNGVISSYDLKKKFKKINYLDFDIFCDFFIAGKPINIDGKSFDLLDQYLIKTDPNTKYTQNEFIIYKSEVVERVYIRKMHEIFDETERNKPIFTDPFIIDKIFFMENSGLYFLLEEKENFDSEFFIKVLKNLGDFGLGTDRNIGNGQFIVEKYFIKNIEIPLGSNFFMNLSLFLPTEEEVEKFTPKCQYRIIQRGGWLSNFRDIEIYEKNQIKKSVYMIEEGSIFENNYDFQGKCVDLRTNNIDHPVWRDGRAIFIPIRNI